MANDPVGLNIPSMVVPTDRVAPSSVQLQAPQGTIQAPQGGNVDTSLTQQVADSTLSALISTAGGVAANLMQKRYQEQLLKGWAAGGTKQQFQAILAEETPITKIFGTGGYQAGARARQASANAILAHEQLRESIPRLVQSGGQLDDLIAEQSKVLDSLKTGDAETDTMLTQQVSESTAALAGTFTAERIKHMQLVNYNAGVASGSAAARLYQKTSEGTANGMDTNDAAAKSASVFLNALVKPEGMEQPAYEDMVTAVYMDSLGTRSWRALGAIEGSGLLPDDKLNTLLNTRASMERKATMDTLLTNEGGWFDRKLDIIEKATLDPTLSGDAVVAMARKVNEEWMASGMRHPIFSTEELESLQARSLSAILARRERDRARNEKLQDEAAKQQLTLKGIQEAWQQGSTKMVSGYMGLSTEQLHLAMANGDAASGVPGFLPLLRSTVPAEQMSGGRLFVRAVQQGEVNPYVADAFKRGLVYNGGVMTPAFEESVRMYSAMYNSLAASKEYDTSSGTPGALASEVHEVVARVLGDEKMATMLQTYYELASTGDKAGAFEKTFGAIPTADPKRQRLTAKSIANALPGKIRRLFGSPYAYNDAAMAEMSAKAANLGMSDPAIAADVILQRHENIGGHAVEKRSITQPSLAESVGFGGAAQEHFQDLYDEWYDEHVPKMSPKMKDYNIRMRADGDYELISATDPRGINSVPLRRKEFAAWVDAYSKRPMQERERSIRARKQAKAEMLKSAAEITAKAPKLIDVPVAPKTSQKQSRWGN